MKEKVREFRLRCYGHI